LQHLSFQVQDEGRDKEILRDVSLRIPDRELVVVTGPNGGGKSTLARLIAGIERPTAGRILFHGRNDTLQLIAQYTRNRHPDVRADFQEMNHWNELPRLASTIAHDHLFVVVTARKGTVSYKAALDRLPDELTQFFSGTNLMIVFPDQYGDLMDNMTFAQPQHTEDGSAYEAIRKLIFRK